MLGDQRPRNRGAEQVFAFVHRVGAEHRKHEVAHEFLAQVLDEDLLHAGHLRFLPCGFELLALAHVGGEGHHLAAVLVLEPLEYDRRVQPSRIGQDDLLHLVIRLHFFTFPSSRNSISAFWVCSRFSASSQTTLCGTSITSAATSSPRCAARQCMKSAFFFATFIMAASTCQSSKSRLRSSFSASKPMLVQTSVVTRSEPRAASMGSAKLS